MPTFFVVKASDALGYTPSNANDGFDTVGLGNSTGAGTATYNHLTRTYTDSQLAADIGLSLTGCWVYVSGGTGWTPGFYQIESHTEGSGSIVFAAATGVNVASSNRPTLSTGPKDTLANALAACSPGTAANPFTSYAANSACRIVLCAFAASDASHNIASALSIAIAGSAANHNSIVVGDSFGNVGKSYVGTVTVEPSNAFTTGTALITSTFAAAAYLDIEGIRFNGSANTKTATYCINLNAANGNVTLLDCKFTGATVDGLRIVPPRVQATRCMAYSNGSRGILALSGATAGLRLQNCEAYSNTFDGITADATGGEGVSIVECLSHHNGRHGFQISGSNRSALLKRNVASGNGQHGFDLSGAFDIYAEGNIAVGNGTTSSHYQFYFNSTSFGSRAMTMLGNYAGASGSALNTDATNLSTAQLTTGTSDVLRSSAVGTYDGRLKPSAAQTLRALVGMSRGVSGTFNAPPGLSLANAAAGGGGSGGSGGRGRFLGFGGNDAA